MKEKTYIVIDESGATHQKDSNYFVIAGYITKQIYSVKSTHKRIERDMKSKYHNLRNMPELKGSKLSSKQKAEFLNKLLAIQNTISIAIIVDKRQLFKRNHNENIKYNYFLQLLLNFILNNFSGLLDEEQIELYLDNRSIRVGSLHSLEDYLNSSLGLVFNKYFKVTYKNSKEHRDIQMADLIANVLFGYYNNRTNFSTYYLVPRLKKGVISKFPYKYFSEPVKKIIKLSNEIDMSTLVWYIVITRPDMYRFKLYLIVCQVRGTSGG